MFHIVFQVVNLIDVTKAASINLLEDLKSFLYNGTSEGVVTRVPFAVDAWDKIDHFLYVVIF